MKLIKISTTLIASAVLLGLTACGDGTVKSSAADKKAASSMPKVSASGMLMPETPPLAPLGKPPIPSDNKQTPAKIALGKKLFFDPRLGGDASVSCATCHAPDPGWGFA